MSRPLAWSVWLAGTSRSVDVNGSVKNTGRPAIC
jgi:hypothetical protein